MTITQSPNEAATQAPLVRHTLTVRRPEDRATYLTKDSTDWDWADLRSYVVTQIERLHGPFPREEFKELGIFKGFVKRHGQMAGLIAETAFDVFEGMWKGAPIGVQRFCAGSDKYFAEEILLRLMED
jgi:hypothetical protein